MKFTAIEIPEVIGSPPPLSAKDAHGLPLVGAERVGTIWRFRLQNTAMNWVCSSGRRITPVRTGNYPLPAKPPAMSVLDKTASWRALKRTPPV